MNNKFFIDNRLYVDVGKKGTGIYVKEFIPENTIIEYSPISSCWRSKWEETPNDLCKIVFSFPQGSNNYVIALGYISIYNHDDNNNAMWYSGDDGIGIRTLRAVNPNEEVCIHYGDGYWSGGWPKI